MLHTCVIADATVTVDTVKGAYRLTERVGGSCLYKKGGRESVFQFSRYQVAHPPQEITSQSAGEKTLDSGGARWFLFWLCHSVSYVTATLILVRSWKFAPTVYKNIRSHNISSKPLLSSNDWIESCIRIFLLPYISIGISPKYPISDGPYCTPPFRKTRFAMKTTPFKPFFFLNS